LSVDGAVEFRERRGAAVEDQVAQRPVVAARPAFSITEDEEEQVRIASS